MMRPSSAGCCKGKAGSIRRSCMKTRTSASRTGRERDGSRHISTHISTHMRQHMSTHMSIPMSQAMVDLPMIGTPSLERRGLIGNVGDTLIAIAVENSPTIASIYDKVMAKIALRPECAAYPPPSNKLLCASCGDPQSCKGIMRRTVRCVVRCIV